MGYVVILLFAGWPIASVMIAATVASWNDCTLHEGFVNPCIVNGQDIGGTLYSMSVMGWMMLATIPLGAIAFVLWTVVWAVWRVVKQKKAEQAAAIGSPPAA